MKKEDVKIGQRVAVYSTERRNDQGEGRDIGAIVTEVDEDNDVRVNFPDGDWDYFHIKQLRLLKKKPKQEIFVSKEIIDALSQGFRISVSHGKVYCHRTNSAVVGATTRFARVN